MTNREFNAIQRRLDEDESRLFEILSDPVAYNESTGGRVGQGGPYPASVSQIMKTLLSDWSDARIQNAVRGLESRELIDRLSSSYNVLCTDRGIRLLQNWLTQEGKDYAQWLASIRED